MSCFNNKDVLATGGIGSFGRKFVTPTLIECKPLKIMIYNRDELVQRESCRIAPFKNEQAYE